LGVGALVAIDLTILTVYYLVEGIRGNLVALEVPHKEKPTKVDGVSNIYSDMDCSVAHESQFAWRSISVPQDTSKGECRGNLKGTVVLVN
jgi:hypothetical protein